MAPRHELPPLPYGAADLDPYVSSRTVDFHYGKHHRTYVDNTNKLIADSPLAELELEELIRQSAGHPERAGIFNNAAQVWNHTFYWNSMRPKGGGTPSGDLKARVEQAFGSFEAFSKEFATQATTLFGSGWCWLVAEGGTIKIVRTSNADTPIVRGQLPLLTVDVWEHAYYLDFQNRRADYVAQWLSSLANWEFAAGNLARAPR
jgi:Fe-Mn family superoxide dismutase